MPAPRFAAIVPVGPHAIDVYRGVEVIKSLLFWEPDLAACVVVDDARQARGLSELACLPGTCRTVTLVNPRRGRGHYWSGGVATALLSGLAWVQARTDAAFALVIETDALVIGPFATQVQARLRDAPDAGMLGSLGVSCHERFIHNFDREPALLTARRLLPRAVPGDPDPEAWIVQGLGPFTPAQRRRFDALRPVVDAAVAHGYRSSEFCHGGAHVVTRQMMDRLAAADLFAQAESWMHLPFYGDHILPMYARAVGLRLQACSGIGEPFALQDCGLAYTLDELVTRGHSVIHSVKNDTRYSEATIRDFFRRRMAASDRRTSAAAGHEPAAAYGTWHGQASDAAGGL